MGGGTVGWRERGFVLGRVRGEEKNSERREEFTDVPLASGGVGAYLIRPVVQSVEAQIPLGKGRRWWEDRGRGSPLPGARTGLWGRLTSSSWQTFVLKTKPGLLDLSIFIFSPGAFVLLFKSLLLEVSCVGPLDLIRKSGDV